MSDRVIRQRRAPRSAGLAGIVFSLLFLGFAVLVAARPPSGVTEAGLVEWFEQSARGPVTLATMYVAPFAGIAFLWFLAVDPVRQRSGVGRALLEEVFEGAGAPVYLDTSTPDNLPYYSSFGFEQIGRGELPRGAKMWFMRRP